MQEFVPLTPLWILFSIFWPFGPKSRGERIRTSGLLVPNQALYQAELRPVKPLGYTSRQGNQPCTVDGLNPCWF